MAVESGAFIWTLLLTALTTGLMGGLHCLGMCGGISATVALASPPSGESADPTAGAARTRPIAFAGAALAAGVRPVSRRFAAETNVLAFNAGRIASYALAGALAGTLGGMFAGLGQGWVISETLSARTLLFLLANLMVILTGLYLMGVPQVLAPLERAGGHVWRHISPWTRRLLPLRSPSHAALFGMVWGWIPCGMVYAMLLTAMSAGSAGGGALTMLAFGAGTLPAMVGAGWSAGRLRGWTRQPRIRLAAGIAVIALGVWGIARAGSLEQLQAFGAFCVQLVTPSASAPAAP
ncbi:MAG: sulfite exporter TauE/SafE family protein [Betaproteobacteria bacterium]